MTYNIQDIYNFTDALLPTTSSESNYYTFCCSFPENILSLMPTSNLLMKKYIHFSQSM